MLRDAQWTPGVHSRRLSPHQPAMQIPTIIQPHPKPPQAPDPKAPWRLTGPSHPRRALWAQSPSQKGKVAPCKSETESCRHKHAWTDGRVCMLEALGWRNCRQSGGGLQHACGQSTLRLLAGQNSILLRARGMRNETPRNLGRAVLWWGQKTQQAPSQEAKGLDKTQPQPRCIIVYPHTKTVMLPPPATLDTMPFGGWLQRNQCGQGAP